MSESEATMSAMRMQLWLQFVAVILTVVALAMHGEGRLAKIEQSNVDAAWSRDELASRMVRIEDRVNQLAKR